MIEYIEDFHNTFQRPIWVTEWACQNFNGGSQCSMDDIEMFLNTSQSFMDQSDFVERYAWFGAMENMQGVNSVRTNNDSKIGFHQLTNAHCLLRKTH
jgi:hypothetical protein